MTSIQLDLPPAPVAGAKIERVLGSCNTMGQADLAQEWVKRVISIYREQEKPDITVHVAAWAFYNLTMRLLFYGRQQGLKKLEAKALIEADNCFKSHRDHRLDILLGRVKVD